MQMSLETSFGSTLLAPKRQSHHQAECQTAHIPMRQNRPDNTSSCGPIQQFSCLLQNVQLPFAPIQAFSRFLRRQSAPRAFPVVGVDEAAHAVGVRRRRSGAIRGSLPFSGVTHALTRIEVARINPAHRIHLARACRTTAKSSGRRRHRRLFLSCAKSSVG